MRLRSDKRRDKFAQALIVMHDKTIREALTKAPVEVGGVKITRRELLELLLA